MVGRTNFHQDDPRRQADGDGNDSKAPIAGEGDMTKAVYDSNNDGRVDSADHATTANTADNLADNPGFELYYGYNDAGVKGWHAFPLATGGTFLGASDTPSSYLGAANYYVKVNGAGTALEFVQETPVGSFTDLDDVPSSYSGQAQKLVRVNAGETALEFVDPPPDPAVLVSAFAASTLADNEVFSSYVASYAFTIPAGGTNSHAVAQAAATGAVTVDLKKNGTNFGTITWSATDTVGSFTIASATAFAAGDVLTMVQNGTADATLSDIAVTIRGDI